MCNLLITLSKKCKINPRSTLCLKYQQFCGLSTVPSVPVSSACTATVFIAGGFPAPRQPLFLHTLSSCTYTLPCSHPHLRSQPLCRRCKCLCILLYCYLVAITHRAAHLFGLSVTTWIPYILRVDAAWHKRFIAMETTVALCVCTAMCVRLSPTALHACGVILGEHRSLFRKIEPAV